MIGRIRHITKVENSQYEAGTFAEFRTWLIRQPTYQLDIETDITPWWNTRKLISLQFGSCSFDEERTQWFLQWSALSPLEQAELKQLLMNPLQIKLIHNAAYEYIVLRFYGIILENVYDTMLAEKVLQGGIENENYALADISYKYLRIIMNKALQKEFGDDIITDDKIEYGITDVAYLDVIRREQLLNGGEENLLFVFGLEMETCLAFSDITYNGMLHDKAKWRENERLAIPVVEEALKRLNAWTNVEPFDWWCRFEGHISDEDRSQINMNSHPQKKLILNHVCPELPGSTKVIIQKFLDDNPCTLDPLLREFLLDMYYGDKWAVVSYMEKYHRQWLIDNDLMIPAGKVTINWNSPDQVLPLIQLVEPKARNLSEESRNKMSHRIVRDLEAFKQANKLITDLGEGWIEKYVGPDGKVRTNFNQIVSTGRVSSKQPNMQNITVDESVGTRYRNAFICEEDEEFVDSDYISQELVLIAAVSKDPVWMQALDNGWDLHSICAELVYKKRWKDAAEPGCAYYKGKKKCDCKKHKVMRNGIKTINFGLAYGMSEIKLSGTLGISVREALNLINEYFTTFPLIKGVLDYFGNYGLDNGYIMTLAPFYRKRWFPYWKEWQTYIPAHRQGIKYVPALGEIDRASKNHPIQGTSADITKCAMVLIRSYIRDHNLWDKVKLVAQVHDQVTTVCKKSFSEQWKPIMDKLMADGARIVLPSGILKAETQVTPYWTK